MKDTFNPEQRRRLMELAGIPVEEVKALDSTGETVHGQELYNILPDTLYHATTKKTWDKIQKDGYLGYYYNPINPDSSTYWADEEYDSEYSTDDNFFRGWQKPGWGVFLGTDPEESRDMSNRQVDSILVVRKKDLKPELCYFDGDQVWFYKDRDLESHIYGLGIFYADKIPADKVKFYQEI